MEGAAAAYSGAMSHESATASSHVASTNCPHLSQSGSGRSAIATDERTTPAVGHVNCLVNCRAASRIAGQTGSDGPLSTTETIGYGASNRSTVALVSSGIWKL